MADIIITPLPGKIDFFTNKGDNTPINGVKLVGSNLVFYGPISASSILTNGGGRYVTTTSPTINYVPKFNSNSSIANSLIFDNGTNVGIGTNKPSASLQVISSTAGGTLLRADGTSGTLFSVIDDLTDSLMSVNNSAGLPVFEVFADDRIVAGQYGTNDFVLTNNKVGIGTNNPIGKLHVTGSTSTPAGIFLGDVGIGTTAPTSQANYRFLQVNGPTSAIIETTVGGSRIGGFDSTSNTLFVGTIGSYPIVFRTAVNEKMRIAADGNVGIGTTTPAYKLDINGITRFQNIIRLKNDGWNLTDEGQVRFYFDTSGRTYFGSGNGYEWRSVADAALMVLTNAGNVGIGTTTPTSKLFVSAGTLASNQRAAYISADITTNTTVYTHTLNLIDSSADANTTSLALGTYSHVVFRNRAVTAGSAGGILDIYTRGVATDPTVKMTITDVGNVGIGTTAPTAKLQIGTNSVSGVSDNSINARIGQANAAGIVYGLSLANTAVATVSNQSALSFIVAGDYSATGIVSAILRNTSTAATDLVFTTYNSGLSERMRIQYDGNVGIGTTSPAYKLDVNGTFNVSGTSTLAGVSVTGTINSSATEAIRINNNNGYISFYNTAGNTRTGYLQGNTGNSVILAAENSSAILFAIGGSEIARIATSGNVGIGTTAPARKLDISGSAVRSFSAGGTGEPGFIVDYPSSNGYGAFFIHVNGTRRWRIGSVGDTNVQPALNFWQEGTGSRMYINNLGNVGIGTSGPAGQLDVYASGGASGYVRSSVSAIRLLAYGDGSNWIQSGTGTGTSAADLIFSNMTGTSQWMRIQGSTGNVGIGTTSPGAKLAIIGNRLTDPNNDAQSREIYYAVSRTVATAAGSTTLLGYLTPTSRSDNAVIEIYHHDCGTIEYVRFVVNSVYYTGATTDWVQLPSISNLSYSGALDGCTVDARMSSNFGNIELRLRSLGGSCADMAVFVSIKTNCLFTSQTTTGTGGTVAGLLCNNAYQFPVGANRFQGTRNRGLYVINTGNVGINTQNPTAMLHVSGSTAGDEVFVGTISDNQIVGGRTGGSFGIATKSASNGNLILTAGANMYLRSGGSNDRVFIKSDGNVGIGNVTPQTKLEVSGETMVNYTNAIITVQGGSGYGLIRMYGNNSSVEMQMDSHSSNANAGTLGTYTNHPVYIKTNNTTKVSITTSGNVGIGTTSPSATLTVIATNNTGSRIQLGTAANNTFMDANKVNDFMILTAPFNSNPASVANAGAKWGIKLNGSIDTINTKAKSAAIYAVSEDTLAGYNRQVGLALHTSGFDLENTERVRINNLGNVGIGTTSPSVKLAVSDGTTVAQINPSSGVAYFGTVNNYPMALSVNSSEKVRIAADGNVGIGTTTLFSRFVVSNGSSENFEFSTASTVLNGGTIEYINRATATTRPDFNFYLGSSNGAYKFFTQGTNERMRIAADGNVGINTSSPAAKLDVNGSAIIRGTLSSDSSRVAVYTTLTGASGNWFPLFQINDAVDGTVLCNIKTFAHSSVTFTAAEGYSPSQTHVITILNSQQNANSGYANITGVRIRESGTVEIQLSWASGPAVDISAQVIGTSYTPTFAASLAATTAVDTIVDSVTLQSGLIRTKRNMVADGYVTGGSVGAGISAPTSILHVRASAPTSVGTAPTGTNVLIDSNTSNYITFRNTADNGTYAGLAFLDNNVGGYIVFRNYTGDVTTGSDSMIYGTYQDHIFQNSSSETINGKTETMRIKSNGNVGIGTNNPGYKLDVNGTFRSTGDLYTNGNIVIVRAGAYLYINGTNSDAEIVWQANGSNRWAMGMNVGDATENFNVYNYTTATTNFTILKASGNVGIGTASPANKLSVAGAADIGNTGYVAGQTGVLQIGNISYNYLFTQGTWSSDIRAGILANCTDNWEMAIHDSGQRVVSPFAFFGGVSSNYIQMGRDIGWGTTNVAFAGSVGVGTTAPTGELHIYGSQPAFRIQSSVSGNMQFGQWDTTYNRIQSSGRDFLLISTDATNLIFSTNTSERMRITSGGNVGIGTTTVPTKFTTYVGSGAISGTNDAIRLQVSSYNNAGRNTIVWAQDTGNLVLGRYGLEWNSSNSQMNFVWRDMYNSGAGSTELMRLTGGGSLGIGTTTPSALLHAVSSTAGATLLRADGTSGTLFSVVDDLTDSLMSVNNSAGLPVFEVFADDRIVAGQYGANDFVIANNEVGIGTNNPVAKLHVTGSSTIPAGVFLGSVGIGTTSPSYRLQVTGETSFNGVIRVGSVAVLNESNNANDIYANIRVIRNLSSTLQDGMYINYGSYGTTNAHLRFFANAANERMRIQANDGFVGIGTTSAVGRLDVYDSTDAGHAFFVRNASTGTSAYSAIVLRRNGDANGIVLFTNSSNRTTDGGAGNSTIRTDNGNLLLGAGGTTYHALTTAGSVGIGSTSPACRLDVAGSIKVSAKLIQNSTTLSVSGTGQTLTLNLDTAAVYVVSMASSATITTISYTNRDNNPSVNTIMLVVKYAGTASITFTNVIWANGVAPTLTGTNGYADVFMLTSYQGGAGTPVWIGTVVAQALVSTNL